LRFRTETTKAKKIYVVMNKMTGSQGLPLDPMDGH